MGIASRIPNAHTNTGRATTPPPKPATPAMVNPTAVAITTATILIISSSNRLSPKKARSNLVDRGRISGAILFRGTCFALDASFKSMWVRCYYSFRLSAMEPHQGNWRQRAPLLRVPTELRIPSELRIYAFGTCHFPVFST